MNETMKTTMGTGTSRAMTGTDENPFSVNLWGSHPDDDNDDCYMGADFATLEEARACVANLEGTFNMIYHSDTPFVEIDGPGVNEVIRRKVAPTHSSSEDREWRREIAIEAGMLHGIDAYNDEMGYYDDHGSRHDLTPEG